ncbi:MAG: flagellar filament outer layer protein FlaA [Brevinematia bacterium]
MKKGVVAILSFLVIFSSVSFSAVKKMLIDFPVYEKNIATVVEKDQAIRQKVLEKDKSYDLTQYGFPEVKFTADDWKIENWKIILASSASTTKNNVLSYTKKTTSKRFGEVLGARIHFIEGRFLSWAMIRPPFDFFPYYDDGSDVNRGDSGEENSLVMGILMNVGQIKSISSWVYGLNYQMQVVVRLRDRDDMVQDYFMGSVYYDGWRKLVWTNPEYTDSVQDRVLRRIPLYPKSYPFVAFDSYIVLKPETEMGGDFVIYFKDVEVEYDRAIIREELDIDDESVWNILSKERIQRRIRDLRTIGEKLYLYKQEEARQKAAATEAGVGK